MPRPLNGGVACSAVFGRAALSYTQAYLLGRAAFGGGGRLAFGSRSFLQFAGVALVANVKSGGV